MRRRLGRMAAAALAASALSGCVAAVFPVIAGGAVLGTTVDRDDRPDEPADERRAPPATTGTAEVALPGSVGPALAAPAAPAAVPAVATPPAPAPRVAPAGTPLAALQLTSFDPAFAQLADYALAAQRGATADAPPRAALLADPVALDGARRVCLPDQPAVVLIDLDPAGRAFAAPASLPALPEHIAALARLRAAKITIAWISQSPITETGAIRSALEGAGFDPRGQDVLVLAREPGGRKQALREALAETSCILAIGGDERTDFDERFRYLRDPAAGARLELLIGEGPWFLIRNIFSSTPSTGTPTP